MHLSIEGQNRKVTQNMATFLYLREKACSCSLHLNITLGWPGVTMMMWISFHKEQLWGISPNVCLLIIPRKCSILTSYWGALVTYFLLWGSITYIVWLPICSKYLCSYYNHMLWCDPTLSMSSFLCFKEDIT